LTTTNKDIQHFSPNNPERKPLVKTNWFRCTLLGVSASLALSLLTCQSTAQVTLIDFENIPPTYTPVDSFGVLLPHVTLGSDGQWIASEVNNSVFENIHGRAIEAFPVGSAPLSISFDALVHDVTMDFGSGILGHTLTIGVSGYLNNQAVFTASFVTHPVAGGADEVRAQTFGMVDRVVVAQTAGDTDLVLDNLSFVAVPEPGTVSLLLAGGLMALWPLVRRYFTGRGISKFRSLNKCRLRVNATF
jgi:hypothetical protein